MSSWLNHALEVLYIFLLHGVYLNISGNDSLIILLNGDIETNPGPEHSFSSQGLKICYWNLNSLS